MGKGRNVIFFCQHLTLSFQIKCFLFQAGPLAPFGMMGMVSIIVFNSLYIVSKNMVTGTFYCVLTEMINNVFRVLHQIKR